MENNIVYQESQRFTQWWLWVPLLALLAFLVFQLFSAGELPHSTMPANASPALLLALGILILVMLLLSMLKLIVSVTQSAIHIYYKPFLHREVNWEEMASAEIIQYGFVGFGFRFSRKYGGVYNVNGNKGLAIELKNGRKLLIGTQNPVFLEEILGQLSRRL